jgi:DNA-binding CsgD family transcriptional regulator
VLRLAAEGLPNAQVAKRLWISEPTVKYHLSRTYEKLGVSNRTGAARWAERHGLLDTVAS